MTTADETFLDIMEKTGAVRKGHFVGTSGRHLDVYYDKDRIIPYPMATRELVAKFAWRFQEVPVDAVVGPAMGGAIFAHWLAYCLMLVKGEEVVALFAEKSERGDTLCIPEEGYPYPVATLQFCRDLAQEFTSFRIEAVVAPAVRGAILSQSLAFFLKRWTNHDVLALYAEKEGNAFLLKRGYADLVRGKRVLVIGDTSEEELKKVQRAATDAGGRVIAVEFLDETNSLLQHGVSRLIKGKNAVVIDDTLTTGGSLKKAVEAVHLYGGSVEEACVIWDRGGVAPEAIGVKKITTLMHVPQCSWSEEECAKDGPCSEGAPIDITVGKGREYLAQKAAEASHEQS